MKLIVIGSDRNLFKKDSDIWDRYLDYGKLFEEIHIIVFSHKNLTNKNIKIGDNVFVYPTNHICKLFYLWDVYSIAKQIISNSIFGKSDVPRIERNNIRTSDFHKHQMSSNWVISAQDAFEAGLAGWMLKKIYKIPLQLQIHTDFLSPYFWQESLMNKIRVLLAKFLIPRADGVRAVSERIKNSIIGKSDFPILEEVRLPKIDILPIFVDIKKIKEAEIKTDLHKKYPQFDFIILMASRISKEKNIGLAVEVMSELVKKYPKLGLVIVGSGPEKDSLELEIRNWKLEISIKIEPWSDDLASYYKTADIFLLTSNYEGYGRSAIEAMAVGLPVVMTDVGLARETIINGENGFVAPVGDSKAIVDSIGSLVADKGKRDRLSKGSLKTIEKLTTKEHYLKLYKEIIESTKL